MTQLEQACAVVAFSFGLRDPSQEPNPCNERLAYAAERIIRSRDRNTLVIAQWEIAEQLMADGQAVDKIVGPASSREYLDSDEVWRQAQKFLANRNVYQVIPIAQPFLHLHRVKGIIRRSGMNVGCEPIGWIGFDRSSANKQWWTKGPMRLLVYSVLKAFGRRPPLLPPA